MLNKIEFYCCPDGSIMVKPADGACFVYEERHRHITEELCLLIRDLYPKAYEVLAKIYSRSEKNRPFFEYRIVHRFIRCNMGEYDALSYDVSQSGTLNMEDVKCPLRGECEFEGIICKPQLKTKLTEREFEVASLIAEGLSRQEIAEELCISIYTVSRHIDKIKARMHFNNLSQIIANFKEKKMD